MKTIRQNSNLLAKKVTYKADFARRICRRMRKMSTSDHRVGSPAPTAYVIQTTTAAVHARAADSTRVQQLGDRFCWQCYFLRILRPHQKLTDELNSGSALIDFDGVI
jgi:hypothetical protein